ncbi:MAG TPA: hypothetical protein VN426_00750 [Syntrophomonadaceae bacterium]|nr:hypothetical protein [Syntrophomonadaceae bacterium]
MSNTLEQIIDNFDQQYDLYNKMHALAEEQWLLLQEGVQPAVNEQFHQLLIHRQDLLAAILNLNQQNRQYQEQVIEELDLQRFMLSDLKEHIRPEQFLRLQERISDLGRLLASINDIDNGNQQVMEEAGKVVSGRPLEKTSNRQAEKSYREAMNHRDKRS